VHAVQRVHAGETGSNDENIIIKVLVQLAKAGFLDTAHIGEWTVKVVFGRL
jgi:hypothetical protein